MASALYRLGRWCATYRWSTVLVWLLVAVLAGGSAAAFSKPLSNEFSIPGSRFQAVLKDLQGQIPEAAGASGTAVFTSPDGFDQAERQAVKGTLQDWRSLGGVADVVDPFATEQELEDQAQALQDSQAELDSNAEQLDTTREQLDAGQAEIDAGREQLEAAGAPLPDEARAQQEAELDSAQEEIDAGREQLEAGSEQLEDGQSRLDVGKRLADLTDGLQFVSDDGTVAMAQVSFVEEANNLDPALTERVQEIGSELDAAGVQVDYSQEITQDLSSVVGGAEAAGLVVAAIVLLVMLGSLVAAGLPLLMALVGVGVGLAGGLAFSGVVDMNSVTPALALMLGLAVGIDYSLFLLNRHRTQLRQGMAVRESIALATGTSGNAVVFAGLTVIIALTALLVTGVPFLAVMGIVAAGTVAASVLVAVTLTPAVLALIGARALPKRHRAGHGPKHARDAVAEGADDTRRGWAAGVVRRPWLAVLGVVAVVALLAFPTTSLRLGLPDGSAEPPESTAYQTYDLVRDNFGAGANGPIIAVATMDQPLADGELAMQRAQADLAEDLAEVPDVDYVLPFGISEDRSTLAFQVVPGDGPSEQSTVQLVHALTEQGDQIGDQNDATLGFTGQTVANIDISEQLADALPVYLVVVIGLSLVLLLLVFRSVVVPLLATGGFLLSLGAAFGVVVAIYQWGLLGSVFQVHEPGPILSFLPILLIGVLFGLAMDYQVFLVSAMREAHVHGESAVRAVVGGFNHSARVVTAAAIIMISVFGGFVFAELTMIRPIGLGLAVGVLVDAFLVRMTLTPAVMGLLGEKAWYLPRWLGRVLPDVDVEGARLERQVAGPPREVVSEPA